MSETGTDLAVRPDNLPAIIANPTAVDEWIAKIRAEVEAHTPDTSTAKGRKAIASLAYKIARSKTTLDEAGKQLNADKRAEIAAVDAERRRMRDALDEIQAQARKPLLEWEAAEAKRVAALRERLAIFDGTRHTAADNPIEIEATIDEMVALEIGDDWQEVQLEAYQARDFALAQLRQTLADAKARETQEAEEHRLAELEAERQRQAEEERQRREREAEAERQRLAAEEAEQQRIEAERAESARKEREAREREEAAERAREQERQAAAQRERDAEERHRREIEAVEQRAREAEEQRKRDAEEAERRRIREAAEAERKRQEEAEAERARIEREEADAKAAEEMRRKDKAHRTRITTEIAEAINGTVDGTAGDVGETLAAALIAGHIPHTKVTL